MLISHVSEEGNADMGGDGNHAEEYQTANELFELMAKNHNFRASDNDTLTTRDLVLIYKNIDLGTKLMSNAKEFKKKNPNQYVETVVYEDHDSESDLDEVYSAEDLHNVVMINKERIDLLNNSSSIHNTLCHKLGEFKMQATNSKLDCGQNYPFLKDPYIQEQLESFNLNSSEDHADTLLPVTLLDYICCKRLEDNYTFYMENIIKYVKHTIDQLRRISNGDFLTDKAKEMWKEVEHEINSNKCRDDQKNNTKVLATSTSIPLHVERKENGLASFWDEIVHSDVDVRSLSKILEKKIVVEVPQSICGSYKFFSKCYNDNLIIRCKKDMKRVKADDKGDERLDVVVKLARSESGHVMSNIESIMFLETKLVKNQFVSEMLPLPECSSSEKISPTPEEINETNNIFIEEKEKEESQEITPQLKEADQPRSIEEYIEVSKCECEWLYEDPDKPESDKNSKHIGDIQHLEINGKRHPKHIGNIQHPEHISNIQHPEIGNIKHPEIGNIQHSEHIGNIQHPEHIGNIQHPEIGNIKNPEIGNIQHPEHIGNIQDPEHVRDNQHTEHIEDTQQTQNEGGADKAAFKEFFADLYSEDDSCNNWYINDGTKYDDRFSVVPEQLNPEISDSQLPHQGSCDTCDPGYNSCDSWESPLKRSKIEASYKSIAPDELRMTIQRLNMQDSLPEEPTEDSISTSKQRSPTRNRIKSPYENKSLAIEEKKRKKLLEIRRLREKQKIALSEKSSFSSKTKFGKNINIINVPQSSSSVTNLSISNKSFYNSIYGQNRQAEPKRLARRKLKKDMMIENVESTTGSQGLSTTRSQIFADNTFNLDDTMTEMMYIKMNKKDDGDAKESYSDTHTFESNLSSHLMTPQQTYPMPDIQERSQSTEPLVPMPCNHAKRNEDVTVRNTKTPLDNEIENPQRDVAGVQTTKKRTSVDFQKSIGKIYDLISKSPKTGKEYDTTDIERENMNAPIEYRSNSQCSDSGTSLKHQTISSNLSYSSFTKGDENAKEIIYSNSKKTSKPSNPDNVTKVIISTKSQTPKVEKDKNTKKEQNQRNCSQGTLDNPIKAISQLLQEIDNVQKQRIKTADKNKKTLEAIEPNKNSCPSTSRKPRALVDSKEIEPHPEKETRPLKNVTPKDRKFKQIHTMVDYVKMPQPHFQEEKYTRRPSKKISDIMDEYKEGRGEAVRGPSKFLSARLNSLAQPRKNYVQAQIEQYHSKQGRNRISDRFQRLAPSPSSPTKGATINNNKQKNDARKPGAASPQDKERLKPITIVNPNSINLNIALPGKRSFNSLVSKKRAGAADSKNGQKYPILPFNVLLENLLEEKSSPPLSDCDSHLEESDIIAKKLHIMVNSVVKPTLTVLPECNESTSKVSINIPAETVHNNTSIKTSKLSIEEVCIGPVLSNCDSWKGLNDDVTKTKPRESLNATYTVMADCTVARSFNSLTDDSKIQRCMPTGTFHNHLVSFKNLTQAPKQSAQHVMLLQSGDASSIVVKSTLSQELKTETSNSSSYTELKVLSEIQKSTFDWTFTQIPMQITTVGYSFPKYNVDQTMLTQVAKNKETRSSVKTRVSQHLRTECSCFGTQKSCQCFKETPAQQSHRRSLSTKSSPVKGLKANLKERIQTSPTKRDLNKLNEDSSSNTDESIISTLMYRNSNANRPITCTNANGAKVTNMISDIILETSLENIIDEDTRKPLDTFKQDKECGSHVTRRCPIPKKHVISELSCVEEKSDNTVDYSTSLDILVGLLNEIQNITTCQTQITSPRNDQDKGAKEIESTVENIASPDYVQHMHTRNTTYPTYKSEIISLSSLDRLRQLESNASMYSLLISNDGDGECPESEINVVEFDFHSDHKLMTAWAKPKLVDKEITVDIPKQEFVSTCTEVPSAFFPVLINQATSTISNIVNGTISKHSTQSIAHTAVKTTTKLSEAEGYSLAEMTKDEKIVETSETIENDSIMVLKKPKTNLKKDSSIMVKQTETYLKENCSIMAKHDKTNVKEIEDSKASEMTTVMAQTVKNEKPPKDTKQETMEELSIENPKLAELDKCAKLVPQISFVKEGDTDPIMKMKRDVLVTMYSILVFTVFAALSFPQVMYR